MTTLYLISSILTCVLWVMCGYVLGLAAKGTFHKEDR